MVGKTVWRRIYKENRGIITDLLFSGTEVIIPDVLSSL